MYVNNQRIAASPVSGGGDYRVRLPSMHQFRHRWTGSLSAGISGIDMQHACRYLMSRTDRPSSEDLFMAHLQPLTRNALPEFKERFDHYAGTRGFVPNSILTMSRRPAIARAFMDLNKAVLYEGTVAEELKMLVSLIASQASGCRYCQAHMANLSSIYHASDEKIAALWEYESSPLFNDAERAALRMARKAAVVPNDTTQQDFDELARHFDEGQIVEIVATIALFGYLNRWNDTMATDLEVHPAAVAQRTVGPVGWDPGKHGSR
jgi:uncharacterized peroxidase-related enzyme